MRAPPGRPFACCCAARGQYQNLRSIANTVILTKNVVCRSTLKDIADVRDSTGGHPFRAAHQRPVGRPHAGHQASGTKWCAIVEGVRVRWRRSICEVPGVKLSMLDDSAKFIERSIGAVQGM